MIDKSGVIGQLEVFISRHGNARAAAKALKVSAPYLSMVRTGRRPLSAKVLKRLGYRRIVMFEQVIR